ncbi:NifU family protein [Streptomyces sp. NPDC059832]|uniref:NifU family protein n=2 Tax=unclassified Streptomyces TaxID=2593676 RepID=UPI00365AFF47
MMAREESPAAPDWRTTGERIDTLIAASGSGGVIARERSEELVRLVADFYGAGLERLLDLVHQQGRLDDGVLAALADDELVAGVLLVHGLHPYGVETRVERALESVRPYLGSHGGDVELLAVTDEGTVRLRLLGSCDGCPSSSVTLKLAVQGAVEAAAPEITSIEVETADDEDAGAAGPLVPVDSLFARLHAESGTAGDGASWEVVPQLSGLEPGTVAQVGVGTMRVVACRVGTDLFAFEDRCARCERPFEGATLARRLGGRSGDAILRCAGCRAHYDVRRAGVCLDGDSAHLAPLPLLSDGATVSVSVPAAVAR